MALQDMSISQIKTKLVEATDLKPEDIDARIQEKLSQLSGLISEEGAAFIIANELGIKLAEAGGTIKIGEIVTGMRNVEVVGEVQRIYEKREFAKDGREGKVQSFLISDDSGVIRIVCWNDQVDSISSLKESDVFRLKNAYSRDNNGRVELHANSTSDIAINPEGVTVENARKVGGGGESRGPVTRKKVVELNEQDQSVEVLGTIVQVYDPRFFEVCPECNRRVRQEGDEYRCDTHSVVVPTYSYVMNAFIDDGTDNVRSVFWKEQVQQMLAMKNEQILEYQKDPMAFQSVKNNLLGHIVKVQGRISSNSVFDRIELVANNVEVDPEASGELEKLDNVMAQEVGTDSAKPAKSEPQTSSPQPAAAPAPVIEEQPVVKEESLGGSNDKKDPLKGNDEDLVSLDDLEALDDDEL